MIEHIERQITTHDGHADHAEMGFRIRHGR
jgi:hypothetical protein